MTQYEVGDIVRIRPDLEEYYRHNNLGCITTSMKKMAGQEFEVEWFTKTCVSDFDGTGDDNCVEYREFYWLDTWLEPVTLINGGDVDYASLDKMWGAP